jgi:uncharacterized membrane protein YdjX (TVP38/TMEM64 family)
MKWRSKPVALIAAVAVLLTSLLLLPVAEWVVAALAWIDTHREIAWAAYIVLYIAAATLMLPGSIITLGAGFLFGLPAGTAIVSAGSVLGATAAFLIGRFFARDWIAERVARLPRFRALDQATSKDGFLIVLLTRLSPLFPFNLLNYAFGLTAVRLRDFVLASWIGMLPGTVLYVYLGSLAQDLTMLTSGAIEGGGFGLALFMIGLAATLLLTIVLTRRATRALNSQLGLAQPGAADEQTSPGADDA